MLKYSKPAGITATLIQNRPVLTTPQGGKVALDKTLLKLWEMADGCSLAEIEANFQAEQAGPLTLRAALACLAEAGLLQRSEPRQAPVEELTGSAGGLVSVVIVGYESRAWLEECLPSLYEQSYSPLEIIVVDNGSKDDTLPWLREHYPQVKRYEINPPASLAYAINHGVAQAQGEYYLILNPDVRLEKDAIAHMVHVAGQDEQCGAVGAKLRFWWAPAFLNGLGNQVGPFSWGTDNAIGYLDLGQFDQWRELPSACFAAALVKKQAWQQVGPVDEGFPMYYEDSEWCYRLRMLGYKVLAAPKAVVYHAFGGRVPSGQPDPLSPRKLRNVVYGRMRFAFKIPGDLFPNFFRNYCLEDWINFSRYLLQRNWAAASAYLGAWKDLFRDSGTISQLGRELQARRKINDEQLFSVQRALPMAQMWNGLPELTWDLVLTKYAPEIRSGRTHSMPEFDQFKRRPHLLVVSNDVVDEKMAGPGMRYLEMARALSQDLDVTLAIPAETKLTIPNLNLVRYWDERPGSLQVLVENSDIALVSGYMVEKFPFLQTTATRLVVDLYDPTILENLHYYLNEPMESQQAMNRHGVGITNRLMLLGDFFICGNERQRDFWLGFLAANERINPLTFHQDSSLRSLIDVVGIGFPDRELRPKGKFLLGVHPQIPQDAQIVLWGGGIWNWLDPLTLVKAWPQVVRRNPRARLVFLGTRHPNPLVPVHEMARKAMDLAAQTGELDRTIIFIDWVSYEDRETLLHEASIGVALHPIHVETRYSIRTRILDYLWARLPVLITTGDITSEWVKEYQLGAVVPEFDAQAVAEALDELLSQPKESWYPAFEPLIARFRWSEVVKPLKRYAMEGSPAPDRQARTPMTAAPSPVQSRLARAVYIGKTEGLRSLAHRLWRHLQWRLSRP